MGRRLGLADGVIVVNGHAVTTLPISLTALVAANSFMGGLIYGLLTLMLQTTRKHSTSLSLLPA